VSDLPTAAATVALREVTKRYDGAKLPAVDALTLEIPAGEVCVLVGPSGCGKTTALKMINRLIEPTSGEITIDGRDARALAPAQLRRHIGYVIQQVGLLPHLTIAANVATVPKLLGWERHRITTRVGEMLDLVGLPADEYGDRYPSELSGGQQQRIGLARALAADPPLMLMDEPFSAVDPITRDRLQNDFLSLQRTVAKTVVFVTHDVDEAVKMADRIAVMRDGRLVQYATPAELLANPVDAFVADFVGADRALKRLSLMRVADLALTTAPGVTAADHVEVVHSRLGGGDLAPVDGYLLVTDAAGHPQGWVSVSRLNSGGRVGDTPAIAAQPLLQPQTTARDALSQMFDAGARCAAVVDTDGVVIGVVEIATIARVANPDPMEASVG
jgi:osmoprotectant transport system ATP-binding protein